MFKIIRYFSSFSASKLEIIKTSSYKKKLPIEDLVFGRCFTDHMLTVGWDKSEGWSKPTIKPYSPLQLNPSASVFHYATECFEGLKAYRNESERDVVRMFRPQLNMERFLQSSQRLALPGFDPIELMECIKRLVKLESSWIPSKSGHSLYIRPTMIATNECIGISQPDRALLFVICSPVGPYFKSGFKAIRLLAENKYIRAWPGGTGAFKIGANYGPTILPQIQAAERNFQQILWLFGPKDEITEVGSMNCFLVMKNKIDGRVELVTPPLVDGTILPGVTRDSIISLVRGWKDISVSERRIEMEEFVEAHSEGRILEMFGSGTAAIVCPISCLHYRGKDYEISLNANDPNIQSGPITEKIFNSITEIQYGKIEHEWTIKF